MVRSPGRKRTLPRRVAEAPSEAELVRCAVSAVYVGSPEHKSFPSFAGPPKLRSDASRCPTHLKDGEQITTWLRAVILKGNVSDIPNGVGYPGTCGPTETTHGSRRVSSTPRRGTYTGYPLSIAEAPRGVVV